MSSNSGDKFRTWTTCCIWYRIWRMKVSCSRLQTTALCDMPSVAFCVATKPFVLCSGNCFSHLCCIWHLLDCSNQTFIDIVLLCCATYVVWRHSYTLVICCLVFCFMLLANLKYSKDICTVLVQLSCEAKNCTILFWLKTFLWQLLARVYIYFNKFHIFYILYIIRDGEPA